MECSALGTSNEIIVPRPAKYALYSPPALLCQVGHILPTSSTHPPITQNKAADIAALLMISCVVALYSLDCFLWALLDAGTTVCALLLIDRCHVVLYGDCTGRTILFADMTCDASALAIAVDKFTHIL